MRGEEDDMDKFEAGYHNQICVFIIYYLFFDDSNRNSPVPTGKKKW